MEVKQPRFWQYDRSFRHGEAATDSKFHIDPTAMQRKATGLRFPEGPIAMPDGSVLLVEIAAGRLSCITPDGDHRTVAMTGGGPNGAALGPDGACYICNNGGMVFAESPEHGLMPVSQLPENYKGGWIERVDLVTGEITRLYERVGDHLLCAPNDIVFDRQGGFWFTDYGKTRARDADHGGVYYAALDGSEVRQVIYPLLTPNGIGLSPDETRLYVAETACCRLWEFEIPAPGEVASRPFPSYHGGRLLYGSTQYQRFDSLAVDAEGNICVATILDGAITVVRPEGGELARIPLPDIFPTNICFGGPDLKTAFVTLSGKGEIIAFEWPVPGHALNFSRSLGGE